MINITKLTLGDEFYFTTDTGTVFIFIELVWKYGVVQAAKCVKVGKISPTYISAKHDVVVLPKYKN